MHLFDSFFHRKTLLVLILLVFTNITFSQKGTIRGFVYEKENSEPIIFTNVYLLKTTHGASTDVNGFFTITQIPPGTYTLIVTYLGYDTIKLPITIKADQIINQKIYMTQGAKLIEGINVFADREEAKTETKTSVIKVTPKHISQIPSIGGKPDLAQYLQVVPGVVFTGDQGGQLYIRGGSPIQNKMIIDGMIIYNPFHSIGLFSVFETEIIRNADIYTGGFGAEHGGRISSVMDITSRDGNKNRIAGKVGMSTFGADALIEGPLLKSNIEKGSSSSFIFTAKNSYLKQTSKTIYNYIDTAGLPFNYLDLYGKVSFNTSNGSKISFFGFNFADQANFKSLSDFEWKSSGGGTSFLLVPGTSPTLIDGNFAYTKYNITLISKDFQPRSSEINGFNMGLNFTYFLGKDQIKYGIEMLGFGTDFNFINSVNRVIKQAENTTELAGFLKYKYNRGKLILEPGLRVQYYASLSELSPEPRLAAKYNITEYFRMKFAGGWYSQNLIAGNSDRDVVNLFYGFISGPDNLPSKFNGKDVTHKLQKAQHLILGFEYDLRNLFSFNLEGYFKNFSQLTNLNRNKIFEDNQEYASKPDVLKKDYIIENGSAYGADFSVKYDFKRIYIWAVYSLGYIHRFDGVTEYIPHYDRRHNMNFVASYKFGQDLSWECNVRWNYGSGFPFTQTAGYYPKLNFEQGINTDYTKTGESLGIQYAALNSGRLPDYHRLDATIQKGFKIGALSSIQTTLSITNIYNYSNIFYVDRLTNKRVDQLPFMPSFGVVWKF